MVEFGKLIEEIHPGIFIHSVYIEEELDKDRNAGFVRCVTCCKSSAFVHQRTTVWKCERTN